ncbi:phosphotransferase family protein [Citricoccus zhacaiensis]
MLAESAVVERVAAAARNAAPWAGAGPAPEVAGMRRLPGGVSSLTYAAVIRAGRADGYPVVIKIAPPGLAPVRNRDVLRQSRLMAAIGATGALPVPRILMDDDGDPPLFVMDLAPGQSYEPLLDVAENPPPPSVVRERALVAAASLAGLQGLDPVLAGTGEPVLGLRTELDRWERLLQTVPDEIVPGHAELYRRLAAAVPTDAAPVLVHGDYRQANMLFEGPVLNAVIDWEIWSLGDPRLDLAWLLMHTAPAHRYARTRPAADQNAGAGMPSREELVSAYLESGGPARPDDLPWFLAYSYYKVASTLGVIVKRSRKDSEPPEHLLAAADSLPDVVSYGLEALSGR